MGFVSFKFNYETELDNRGRMRYRVRLTRIARSKDEEVVLSALVYMLKERAVVE